MGGADYKIVKDTFRDQGYHIVTLKMNTKDYGIPHNRDRVFIVGFLDASKMPLRAHENILVFYKKLPTYNPIKTKGHKKESKKESQEKSKMITTYGKHIKVKDYCSTERYPRSVLKFSTDKQKYHYHPTQKPRELISYFITTFTNKGDTVLDNCAGSGTTAVECERLERNFICFENGKNDQGVPFAKIANQRLLESRGSVGLFKEVN